MLTVGESMMSSPRAGCVMWPIPLCGSRKRATRSWRPSGCGDGVMVPRFRHRCRKGAVTVEMTYPHRVTNVRSAGIFPPGPFRSMEVLRRDRAFRSVVHRESRSNPTIASSLWAQKIQRVRFQKIELELLRLRNYSGIEAAHSLL
jgi:hypothetical protein